MIMVLDLVGFFVLVVHGAVRRRRVRHRCIVPIMVGFIIAVFGFVSKRSAFARRPTIMSCRRPASGTRA